MTKDPDGRPAQRDPTFLAESNIMSKQLADRILGDKAREVRRGPGKGRAGWRVRIVKLVL